MNSQPFIGLGAELPDALTASGITVVGVISGVYIAWKEWDAFLQLAKASRKDRLARSALFFCIITNAAHLVFLGLRMFVFG